MHTVTERGEQASAVAQQGKAPQKDSRSQRAHTQCNALPRTIWEPCARTWGAHQHKHPKRAERLPAEKLARHTGNRASPNFNGRTNGTCRKKIIPYETPHAHPPVPTPTWQRTLTGARTSKLMRLARTTQRRPARPAPRRPARISPRTSRAMPSPGPPQHTRRASPATPALQASARSTNGSRAIDHVPMFAMTQTASAGPVAGAGRHNTRTRATFQRSATNTLRGQVHATATTARACRSLCGR